MKGCKPIPDADGICRMAFANLVKNCPGIGVARRRKHAIHNEVDIRIGAQGAGKSLSSTLRFRLYGPAHLEESGVQFALAEKEIGIAPGNFSGKWISAFRMKESIASGGNIPFGFVGGSQVRPKIRRTRVERQSYIVRSERSRRVRLFEVVLPIAGEQEPVLEVARLKARGPLIPLTSLQSHIVSGKRVSHAEVGKEQEADKSKSEHDGALFGTERTVAHPTVLCLDRETVARKIRRGRESARSDNQIDGREVY